MTTSNDSNNGFKVGDIVYYPMLGRGKVCSVSKELDRSISVKFDSGGLYSFYPWQLSKTRLGSFFALGCGVSIALVVVAVFLIAWLISFIPVFAGLKYIFD